MVQDLVVGTGACVRFTRVSTFVGERCILFSLAECFISILCINSNPHHTKAPFEVKYMLFRLPIAKLLYASSLEKNRRNKKLIKGIGDRVDRIVRGYHM